MTVTVAQACIPLAQSEPRRLSILGATGSIGCSTLDVVSHHPGSFEVVALVGNSNIELLAEQARTHRAKLAVTADPERYGDLRDALSGSDIEVAAGPEAVVEAAQRDCDQLMAAIVGAAGLAPTLAAVRRGTTIGLANKECLVSAGDLFMAEAGANNINVIPVDSEHNAIFQVLDGDNLDQISRIILTASGGPFRTWPIEDIAAATLESALKHPNWSMGPKITIDSATMMNKGLELIEAFHLFPAPLERLDVIVHPQSVVHSMVEYEDGSVLAQLGSPDMRTPIAYALAWPQRIYSPSPRLRLEEVQTLTFEAVDDVRFPSISLCRQALETGHTAPTILNAANEIAVAEFLSKRLSFLDIVRLVEGTLNEANRAGMIIPMTTLEDVFAADDYARGKAKELSKTLN
jgi:1-deoxy-D-xylulose-5-phosphate reductoisomerase